MGSDGVFLKPEQCGDPNRAWPIPTNGIFINSTNQSLIIAQHNLKKHKNTVSVVLLSFSLFYFRLIAHY